MRLWPKMQRAETEPSLEQLPPAAFDLITTKYFANGES